MAMQNTTVSGFRLSPQQERLWKDLGDHAGVAVIGLRIEGGVEAAAVEAALNAVAARHEILRTTFKRQIGMRVPLQVVDASTKVSLIVAGCDMGNPFEGAARAPIDVADGPVLKAWFVERDDRSHELVLALPALCADRATLSLLAREVSAACLGQPFEAADPVQYPDYSEWQRELVDSADDAAIAGRAFWTNVQQHAAAHLPFAQPVEAAAPFRPQEVVVTVPEKVARALAHQADAAGISASHVWLAAWHAFIGRLSGASRIAVRVVVDGRTAPELTTGVGLYAKPLPVVVDVDDESFADLRGRVSSAATEADRWQDYFACDADSAGAIDFDWSAGGSRTLPAGWAVTRCAAIAGRFLAKLECEANASAVHVVLRYDESAIRREDAERMARQFEALLKDAADNPATRVGALSLVDASASPARATGSGRPAAADCLHTWFETQATETPSAIAVCGEDGALTYAQLDAQANQVARWLQQAGVQKGTCVGVCGERSAALLVAVLGVMKAGAAYVPVQADQPPARIESQLEETGAEAVVVTESIGHDAISPFARHVLCLADASEPDGARSLQASDDRSAQAVALQWRDLSDAPVGVETSRDDAAYVLYTSGSTGRPKGVRVLHRNLVAYSAAIVEALTAAGVQGTGIRYATVSALTADLGNTCIFPALVSGGAVHMVPASCTLDGAALGEYISKHEIDVLKITPSHLAAVLDETGRVLPRRVLITGGEPLSWQLVATIRERGRCAIWNHYGPTETTVGALVYPVPASDAAPATRTVPVGRPIGRATVAVVDAAGERVPIGVPGELWIGGAGVSAGYVGQTAMTAERFVEPAWAAADRDRFYRTGDRVWMLADQTIEFMGRIDDQVKIRGYRVEPGEVEHLLQAQTGVREAAVVAVGDSSADRRLIAYVVADGTVSDDELKARLGERLPEYMVPGAVVRLASMPRLANGKVDRRQLATMSAPSGAAGPVAAPRTPIETALVEIWQRLLGKEPIGIHDNFFELGGHSLLATQLIAQVRRSLDVQVPLHAIFDAPTIAGLADAVSQIVAETAVDPEVDRILASVDGLSDEEVQWLLENEQQTDR